MDLAEKAAQGGIATLHSRGDRFMVFDSLLSEDDFESAARDFSQSVLMPRVNNFHSVVDGPSYRGNAVQRRLVEPDIDASAWEMAIASQIRQNLDLFSQKESNWEVVLTFTPWAYPSGSQLHWHKDSGANKIGAFIFYVHRQWSALWGGALAVVDAESQSETVSDEDIMDSSRNPVIIMPKPNRLVLLRANTLHSIQRIDVSAEGNLRSSFAGFIFATR